MNDFLQPFHSEVSLPRFAALSVLHFKLDFSFLSHLIWSIIFHCHSEMW